MTAYDDLLHRQRPAAPKPMARVDRAAQFAPFAALTGYEAAIREAERLTQPQKDLSDEQKAEINRRLLLLKERLPAFVRIIYFQPDDRKSGGTYQTVDGMVQKLDEYRRLVWIRDGGKILMDRISALEGSLFDSDAP